MDFKCAEEVWIAGKGPSIDTYDWSKAGEIYCVNDAALSVTSCIGTFIIDAAAVKRLCVVLPPHLKIFIINKAFEYAHPGVHVITGIHRSSRYATVLFATWALYEAGARTIHYIGFDARNGNNAYADSMKKLIGVRPNPSGYKRIVPRLEKIITELDGLEAIWGE